MPRDERRASIVEATIPLLEAHGQQVTTKQIAEAAGVAEGTIFRVFDSLTDVVDAAIVEALSASRLERLVTEHPFPGELDGDVRTALTLVGTYYETVKTMLHLGHGAGERSPAARCVREELRQRAAELLDALAADFAPHADRLRVAPAELAQLIHLLASGARAQSRFIDAPMDVATVAAVVLDGVRRPA